jgi:glucose-1-phosphate thymidylyltransferase
MKCLILASGFGTRLYPLTQTQAKALLPYKGKPMINHIVDRVPEGIEILVNVNKKFESDFDRWQSEVNREVTLCVEPVYSEEQMLGAISSLNYWIKEKRITDDLMIVGSDNYFEFSINDFIDAYNKSNIIVAIYDIGDKSKATVYGVVRLDNSRIVEFEEKPAVPKSSLVATACWIIPPRIFPLIDEFCSQGKRDNLGSFIAYLVEKEEVYAYVFDELWLDIGSIEVYYSTKD